MKIGNIYVLFIKDFIYIGYFSFRKLCISYVYISSLCLYIEFIGKEELNLLFKFNVFVVYVGFWY